MGRKSQTPVCRLNSVSWCACRQPKNLVGLVGRNAAWYRNREIPLRLALVRHCCVPQGFAVRIDRINVPNAGDYCERTTGGNIVGARPEIDVIVGSACTWGLPPPG